MPHGTPDWGVTAGQVTTYQLQDVGELAARLGSLDTFDRRGDLVWADGFECGLAKWESSLVGAGASVALSTVRARNGSTSCLLTAGSDLGRSAAILHDNPFTALSNLGVETSFKLGGAIDNLDWQLTLFDGVNQTIFRVVWVDATNVLQRQPAAGGLLTFATGVDLSTAATLFHTAKMVIDGVNRNYVRFILDDVSYSLAGLGAQSLPLPSAVAVEFTQTLVGRAGFNDTAYIDDFILTQNEPT